MENRRGKEKMWLPGCHRWAVLLVVGMASVISSCSSGSATSGVASLAGRASTSHSSGPLTQSQSDQDLVDFARCMRAHGVQMSDPFHRSGHAGLSIDTPTEMQQPNPPSTPATIWSSRSSTPKWPGPDRN